VTNEVRELDVVESGSILFVHGVGLDPRLFEPIMSMLSQRSAAPLRPPYQTSRRAQADANHHDIDIADDVADDCGNADSHAGYVVSQADALLDRLVDTHDVTLVGVSGGATLVLAATSRRHPGLAAVTGVIAHEPLVGPLAADLHDAVAESAQMLSDDPADSAAAAFVQRLVGATWNSLPSAHTEFARDHADVIRREVPGFAAYAPTASELASARLPITITTGGLSSQRRHRAAQVVADACGATSLVIVGTGHLVHWEQPAEFAAIIAGEQARWKAAA
jgi:pimeloyl-ACP methyl ester carboxylesterase